MINGERVPSAEAEIRAVQLDLIPSDMIQTIEVNKALTPDMDADAIGGSVNLVTRQAPSGLRVSAMLGSGYNFLAKKPLLTGSLVLGTRFGQKDQFGIVASASLHNHHLGSDDIEAEWKEVDPEEETPLQGYDVYTEDFQVRTYEIQRLRQSYSLGFDWRISDNHTIYINGMYNHRNDWENRYRLRYSIEYDDGWEMETRRQTKGGNANTKSRRLEDQRTYNATLGGDHLFGKVKFTWHGTYAMASEERPDERYVSYRIKGLAHETDWTLDLSDTRKPVVNVMSPYDDMDPDNNGEWDLKEITAENQYTDEKDINGRFDFNIPLAEGKFKNVLNFGGRYRNKQKERKNDFFEYSPMDEDGFNDNTFSNLTDKSKDNFLAGDYAAGHFVSETYLGELALNDATQFEKEAVNEELAGNFTATENIYGGYVSLDQNLGENVLVIVGLRLEQTDIKSQGYSYNEDDDEINLTQEVTSNYLNVLPALHVKYNINPTSILRFAFTNTLARPNYYDLVPYEIVIPEDNEIEVGNPELKATTSLNLDLMFEKYLKSIGIISGGVYYKGIKDFIVQVVKRDFQYKDNVYDKFFQPVNAGDADIIGAEIAWQQHADFLPGAWKGIGWYLNYTYNYSKVKNFNIEDREGEDLPLPGTPQNMFNASLFYEYAGFQFRASYNFATAFRDVDGIGESEFYDRWYDKVNYLDINASYTIKKQWTIFVDLNNITNQPLRYYQGVVDRTMQSEYYNMRLTAGVKFDLVVKEK
jgi:TonB-dependent receptor